MVTEATAIVATRGAGKSSASTVIAEEGHALGVQTVVLDRTGVYWGIRSNAKGTGPGLPFYVLGGPHQDVPLEPSAGSFVADLVVDSGHSFVLDLSDLSKGQAVKFAGSFLERLYDRKARARTTTLLVIDEAHFYAPQTPRGGFKGESATLMGAMEDVVGLGRSRGLGVVLTTQRTQALNKAVLDLIETLLVMRMLSPRARTAVRDWITEKHEEDELGVIASLDSLPTGTAWVWSPLRGVLRKVALRRIRTFDSYATPKPGEARVEPQARKELDLDALGEQMRSTVERAKADDPKELKARVAALERELAARPVEEAEPRVEYVPALDPETHEQLRDLVRQADGIGGELRPALDAVAAALAACEEALERVANPRPAAPPRLGTASRRPPSAAPASTAPAAPRPAPGAAPERSASGGASTNGDLGSSAKHLLGTLGRCYPMRVTAGQLGQLADRKPRGGSWNTAMRQLKDGGFVAEESDLLLLTERGLDEAGVDASRSLSPDEVIERWRTALPGVALAIFDYLLGIYPREVEVERLAADLERRPVGGSWNTAVSTLVRNQLAAKVGTSLRASHDLFPRG